jgi:hypothetical protein
MKSKVFVCVLVVERILGRMIHGVQAYTAYGFDDDKFKYGLSGKWMVDKKNRVILSLGIGETLSK